MEITLIPLDPSYRKESGQWVLEFADIPLPDGFMSKTNAIISLPPHQIGGNHRHERAEVFVGIGEGLEISWLDGAGLRQSHPMNPHGQLYRCYVPPHVPHAIVNTSDKDAIILEFATSRQTKADVERIQVVEYA